MKHLVAAAAILLAIHAPARTITVPSPGADTDATAILQAAIDSAANAAQATIRLDGGIYNISRRAATPRLQHISNTTSETENPNPVKHYGLYFHGVADVTLDGAGSTLLTHGEMTPIAIDSCSSITIRNLTIDAADPSVPEMEVVSRDDSTLVARPEPRSRFRIDPAGRLFWTGKGWEFTGGIAQLYDGLHTLRCPSPLDKYTRADTLPGGLLSLHYRPGEAPACETGNVYQMRHSLRTEVATFINNSSGITLEDVTYRFMGNFGIVGQMSRDISLLRLTCAPDTAAGRTCAGFADFVQMSGCSGLVTIRDSYFAGAHDDPVNVHGTHLRVVSTAPDGRTLTLRYMHPQTYGFEPCRPGDELSVVDAHSLQHRGAAHVEKIEKIDDRNYRVTVDRDLSAIVASARDAVVENLTATPEVEIINNTFTLTPTRGILLTSPRRMLVQGNRFVRIPMASILVADDARSWYESGAVRNLTITGNTFEACAEPAIQIKPENSIDEGPVHTGIVIVDNEIMKYEE